MVLSLAVRWATAASPLLKRLINGSSLRPVAAASSAVNTGTQMTTYHDDGRNVGVDRRDHGVSRRRDSFPFFTEFHGPFFPPMRISKLFNKLDHFMQNPMGAERVLNVTEDDNALYMRMDMPGFDKGDVQVRVMQNVLVIKGKGEKESKDEKYGMRYLSWLDLPANLYRIDGIKAEMKTGVLEVTVSKVKEEERKDVFQVKMD